MSMVQRSARPVIGRSTATVFSRSADVRDVASGETEMGSVGSSELPTTANTRCTVSHHRTVPTGSSPVSYGCPTARGDAALDIGLALRLLADAVRERGEGHVYQAIHQEEGNYLTCRYAHRGKP